VLTCSCDFSTIFLARDIIYALLYAIYIRSFVCPSVCHTGGSVKNVEVMIMQFTPLQDKFHKEILIAPAGCQTRVGEETSFFTCMHQHLENGSRYVKSYY